MKINGVVASAEAFFKEILHKPGVIVGVMREQDLWKVQIEVPEEVEYMRKRAQDDLMAIYELSIDDNLDVVSFQRKHLRERGSTDIGME